MHSKFHFLIRRAQSIALLQRGWPQNNFRADCKQALDSLVEGPELPVGLATLQTSQLDTTNSAKTSPKRLNKVRKHFASRQVCKEEKRSVIDTASCRQSRGSCQVNPFASNAAYYYWMASQGATGAIIRSAFLHWMFSIRIDLVLWVAALLAVAG